METPQEYLFFDIECANCFNGKGKICSFGYVRTDPAFRVLEKRDVLVNPASKFHLRGYIELSYPKEEFKAAPKFDALYEDFRALLTAPGVLLLGFSVLNDLHYLNAECRRYNRPPLRLKVYDVQRLHYELTGAENLMGLKKLADRYVTEDVPLHKSDDDAFVTMRIMEALCREQAAAPDALLAACPDACARTSQFHVTHAKFRRRAAAEPAPE